jgi:glycosyltransferase involved in cell wall biosynthesis
VTPVTRLVHLTTADISLELLLGPQLSAFAAAGYEVVGASAPGPFVERVEGRGVRFVPLRHATRSMALGSDARALAELRDLFRDLRPDIVHTHNPKTGVYGRLAARAAGVPVILNTVHGLYAQPGDALPRRAAVYGLERAASICSQAELVQNPEDLATLRDALHVPTRKLVLLGNGVDLGRFGVDAAAATVRNEVRAELGISEDAVVVGAVGRLVLEKGYAELLTAWSDVAAAQPGAVLVVVGPEEADKADAVPAEMVASARAAGVRFLGMRDDVERLYGAFDLYVLASHREGFPRSAMEAAAAGLPVVATDIRGCRQVVEPGVTGELVAVRSAAELAAAISRLVADATRRRDYGRAGAELARRRFDQRAVVRTTLATYERLLIAAGLPVPSPGIAA